MAIALARCRAEFGDATYISITTISLEDQYMRDFAKLGLRQLHAKSHYRCSICQSCDVSSRGIKSTNGSKSRCQEEPGGPLRRGCHARSQPMLSMPPAA
jgi:hypothetical protein